MAKVFIALGGNLSNPIKQLNIALNSLDELPNSKVVSCSSFYGSTPLGPADQPDFVNAVCELETDLPPARLLSELQAIELEQGRIKKRHWGERLIDLDILLYDDMELFTESLTIPHVEIANRDFVLIPLAEISPGQIIPNKGSVDHLISGLQTSFLKPLS